MRKTLGLEEKGAPQNSEKGAMKGKGRVLCKVDKGYMLPSNAAQPTTILWDELLAEGEMVWRQHQAN